MPSQSYSPKSRKSHVADWERTQQPRVWKGQFRLLLIVLLSLTTWISFPATLYFLFKLLTAPSAENKSHVIFALAALLGSLLLGIFISAATKCSLCHSTPFLERRHRKHQLANDVPLLTYRASAILSLLLRGRFRCMYCSTPYRIGFKSKNDQV